MKKKAFTLIELLVVISIIALLLSILMPALNAAKEQGRAIVCASNVKSLAMAWYVYTVDNDGKLVGADYPGENDAWNLPEDEDGNPTWRYSGGSWSGDPTLEDEIRGIKSGSLYPYVEDVEVYHCLSDKRYKKPAVVGTMQEGGYRSYSIPQGLEGLPWSGLGSEILTRSAKKITDIRRTSSSYVLVEQNDDRGFNMGAWYMIPEIPAWIDPLAMWHHDKSILGFADGHSEIHRWKDKRTIEFQGTWHGDNGRHRNNPDLIYMRDGWAIK